MRQGYQNRWKWYQKLYATRQCLSDMGWVWYKCRFRLSINIDWIWQTGLDPTTILKSGLKTVILTPCHCWQCRRFGIGRCTHTSGVLQNPPASIWFNQSGYPVTFRVVDHICIHIRVVPWNPPVRKKISIVGYPARFRI